MHDFVWCVWESEGEKRKSAVKTQHGRVSITNILVYTPAVDKHLLCLACRPMKPPLSIDISFYANAAFGYVRTRQYFHRPSFIPACLWPYGPRQNYCCTVHKLLSLCQEPLLHIQTADTHSRVMWGNPEAKATEGARGKGVCGAEYNLCLCCYNLCLHVGKNYQAFTVWSQSQYMWKIVVVSWGTMVDFFLNSMDNKIYIQQDGGL